MWWVFLREIKCKCHFKSETDHPQKRGKSDDLSCVVLLLKVTKSSFFQLSCVLLAPLCTFLSLSDRYLVFISFWRKTSSDWGNNLSVMILCVILEFYVYIHFLLILFCFIDYSMKYSRIFKKRPVNCWKKIIEKFLK